MEVRYADVEQDRPEQVNVLDAGSIPAHDRHSKTLGVDLPSVRGKAARGLVTTLAAWPELEPSIKSCGGRTPTALAKLREAVKAVQTSKATLQEKLSLLNDALVGDPNQFTEDAVPLFFYTEVEKLMRSLNERTDWAGGNSTAVTVATSQRELLLDAESRVAQARGEVADLQFELAKLQEQQRQADAGGICGPKRPGDKCPKGPTTGRVS